jgi:spermidine synthase
LGKLPQNRADLYDTVKNTKACGRAAMTLHRPAIRNLLFAGIVLAVQYSAPQTALASDTIVYEKSSAYGNIVVTDEGNGLRALRFGRDGVRQSLVKADDPGYLGLPYLPVALSGLALCKEPKRFLVLGLGGGTIPSFLRKHYPDAEIDAVDINPEVAYAAKNYLGFREDARMRVYIADGRRFIEQVSKPYDAIFLDAFGASAVPEHLTTQEFLLAVRRAVRSDGVVVGNLWHSAVKPSYDSMVRTYRATFDELHILRVARSGNHILFALPRSQALNRDDLAQKARHLSAEKNIRVNLGEVIEFGLMPAINIDSGEVLTDANMIR